MARTFELKTTLSADSNNSSLFVDDTAGYLVSPTEGANLPSAVFGLESTAFGGSRNVPLAGARPEGGGGTVTVSDTPNPQSVVDVASNGNYSAGWSIPADGPVTSSLLVSDPASQSTGANGNVAPPDTDNSLTPTLSVNAQNPADVVFTVSGLGSGYSGTVTFTDSTNESDVVAIKGNGTYSANLSNLADGTLTYLLKASDPAGNVITVDPTTTLGLPPGVTLQPINGGPDYYANNGFTYAANAGWDNPNFFAIGPWEEAVTSEADVTLWHGLNWNTAFNIQANFDLALAGASTGIWVIQNISDGLLPGTGAETVGLLTYDEPSTFAEGVTTPLGTTANSIQDGRFWYINDTWNFIEYGGLNPVNSSAQVLDTLVTTPNGTQVHIDASSIDAYWFSGANISSIQGELGLLDNLGGNGNATAAEVARGSNYGDIITDEEAITGGSQPIFGFVETGGPYTEDTSASDYITPRELNWAVWSELIHGANGIMYFDHSFAGPAQSDSNVQDAYYQTVQPGQTVSIYTQIQETDALVTQLAPVLNSPTALGYVTVNNAAYENGTILSPFSGIEVMAKDDNGQFYIFADTADALTQTNIPATFTIADTNATSVTVVGENRTIPVVDGVFSDTFATAATVHIYEVNDGGSSPPPLPPATANAPVISTGVENSNESVTWTGTAPDSGTPTAMAAGDFEGLGAAQLAASETGGGTYIYVPSSATWTKIDGGVYSLMTEGDFYGALNGNNSNADLAAYDPGYGTYIYEYGYGWSKIDSGTVTTFAAGNFNGGSVADLVASESGAGTYLWANGAGWTKIDGGVYTLMAAGDFYGTTEGNANQTDLAAYDAGYGTYIWANGIGWSKIDGGAVSAYAAGNFLGSSYGNNNQTDLAAYFPGSGTYIWSANAGWMKIDSGAAGGMTGIDLSGSGQGELLEYFPGAGMYEWQSGVGWSKHDNTSALPTSAQNAMFATGTFEGGADVLPAVGFNGSSGVWLDPPATSSTPPASSPVTVGTGATADINAPSAAAVTFAGTSGTLQLDQSASFAGTISGFGGQDQLDLTDIQFGANPTLGYSENSNNAGGSLTVTNGVHTANIALLGNYMASLFVTASDGHGGTLISEAAQIASQTMLLAQPHAAG